MPNILVLVELTDGKPVAATAELLAAAAKLGDPGPTGSVLGLPAAESAEPYRPLSLLAVAGFSLAVLYAVAVTLGGLAVFATRHPTAAKVLLVLAPMVGVVTAVLGLSCLKFLLKSLHSSPDSETIAKACPRV